MSFLVATAEGLFRIEEDGKSSRLVAHAFRHVVPTDEEGEAVALDDAGTLWDIDEDGAHEFDELERGGAQVVLVDGETVWLGTSGGGVLRTDGDELVAVDSLGTTGGAIRSMDIDDQGRLWVVAPTGLRRSIDGGDSWQQVGEAGWDIRQVYAAPASPDTIVAACGAGGLAISTDAGETWQLDAAGLGGTHCRAVAAGEESVLVAAAEGPQGGGAMLYRRALDGDLFVACRGGFPESMPGLIDTHCLAAWDEQIVVALPTGDLYVSNDDGWAWRRVIGGLVEPRAVTII